MPSYREVNNVAVFNIQREFGNWRAFTGGPLRKFIISGIAARWSPYHGNEPYPYDNFGARERFRNDVALLLQPTNSYPYLKSWESHILSFIIFRSGTLKFLKEMTLNSLKADKLMDVLREEGRFLLQTLFTSMQLLHEVLEFSTSKTNDVDNVLGKLLDEASELPFSGYEKDMIDFYSYTLKRISLINMKSWPWDRFERLLVKPFITNAWRLKLSGIISLQKMLMNAINQDPTKFKQVCLAIIKSSLLNALHHGEEAVEVVLDIVKSGEVDIEDTLVTIDFNAVLHKFSGTISRPAFNCILKICEILINHGARLNPSTATAEQPFLNSIVVTSSYVKDDSPCLLELFRDCIKRGTDPKSRGRVSLHGYDLIDTVFHYYKGNDFVEVVQFLLVFEAGEEKREEHLFQLRHNIPFRPQVYDVALILLRNGINPLYSHPDNCKNLLHAFASFLAENLYSGCCKYGTLCRMNDAKFWDLLHLVVDAGVNVNQRDREAVTPLGEVMLRLVRRPSTICSTCFREYFGEKNGEVDVTSSHGNYFTGALNYIDRLIKLEAGFSTRQNILQFLNWHFEGSEMFAIIKIFRDNGIDVLSEKPFGDMA